MSDPKVYAPVLKARMNQAFFATEPTRFTRVLRTNLVWQVFRFALLNLRMIRIIRLGHRKQR
jgi:hypothetical protein